MHRINIDSPELGVTKLIMFYIAVDSQMKNGEPVFMDISVD